MGLHGPSVKPVDFVDQINFLKNFIYLQAPLNLIPYQQSHLN